MFSLVTSNGRPNFSLTPFPTGITGAQGADGLPKYWINLRLTFNGRTYEKGNHG